MRRSWLRLLSSLSMRSFTIVLGACEELILRVIFSAVAVGRRLRRTPLFFVIRLGDLLLVV